MFVQNAAGGGASEDKTHTHTAQPNGGKYMGICLFEPPEGSVAAARGERPRHRHVDIFTCPDDQWACALLTTTGSDVHNRSMRHWCAQMGLALSEKALAPAQREERGCYRDNKYINNKLFVGEHLPVKSEKEIYDVLGLVYVLDAVCFVYTCRRLIDLSLSDCRYKEPHERNGKITHKVLEGARISEICAPTLNSGSLSETIVAQTGTLCL